MNTTPATTKQIDYIRSLRARTTVLTVDGRPYVPVRWEDDFEDDFGANSVAQDLASLPRVPDDDFMPGATTREEKMARGRAWRNGGAEAAYWARQERRADAMTAPLDGLTAAEASSIIDTLK